MGGSKEVRGAWHFFNVCFFFLINHFLQFYGPIREWTKSQVTTLFYIKYLVCTREYLHQIYTVYKTKLCPKTS